MDERSAFIRAVAEEVASLTARGQLKRETELASAQSAKVTIGAEADLPARTVVNLCANNYLGLANHPAVIHAAREALTTYGFGLAAARLISGTHLLHRQLERRLAEYLQRDDALLFLSAFDANIGLFGALLGREDAIISDELNHASIIDGIRLCHARRLRYANSDMGELRHLLRTARNEGSRFILIVTDGIFSMDGHIAPLPQIVRLASEYGALVMVDDCHATGVVGPQGRGTPHHFGLAQDDVGILTGTLGKTLGGAIGGYVAGPKPVIALLRQRARPYLFSNAMPPFVAAGALAAIDLAEGADEARAHLGMLTAYWRAGLTALGFEVQPGTHPIVPVILGEAGLASGMERQIRARGVHVTSLSYPIVPHGTARLRTQITSAHSCADLDLALAVFAEAGRHLGVIS